MSGRSNFWLFGGRGASGRDRFWGFGTWTRSRVSRSRLSCVMVLDANCGSGPDVLPELGNMIPEVDGGQGCQVGVLSGARYCF